MNYALAMTEGKGAGHNSSGVGCAKEIATLAGLGGGEKIFLPPTSRKPYSQPFSRWAGEEYLCNNGIESFPHIYW